MAFFRPTAVPDPIILISPSSHASGNRKYITTIKLRSSFIVQSLRDEDAAGKPAREMVDNNMSVLRRRIHQVRLKESYAENFPLEGACDWMHRVRNMRSTSSKGAMSSVMEMVVVVSSAVGFVFLSGSFCILLVSLVVAWMDNKYFCS